MGILNWVYDSEAYFLPVKPRHRGFRRVKVTFCLKQRVEANSEGGHSLSYSRATKLYSRSGFLNENRAILSDASAPCLCGSCLIHLDSWPCWPFDATRAGGTGNADPYCVSSAGETIVFGGLITVVAIASGARGRSA